MVNVNLLLILSISALFHLGSHMWCSYREPYPIEEIYLIYTKLKTTAKLICVMLTRTSLWTFNMAKEEAKIGSSSNGPFEYFWTVCRIELVSAKCSIAHQGISTTPITHIIHLLYCYFTKTSCSGKLPSPVNDELYGKKQGKPFRSSFIHEIQIHLPFCKFWVCFIWLLPHMKYFTAECH